MAHHVYGPVNPNLSVPLVFFVLWFDATMTVLGAAKGYTWCWDVAENRQNLFLPKHKGFRNITLI